MEECPSRGLPLQEGDYCVVLGRTRQLEATEHICTSAHARMQHASTRADSPSLARSFGLALSAISLLKKEGGAEVPLTRSRRQALPSTWAAAVHRRQRTNLSPAMHA